MQLSPDHKVRVPLGRTLYFWAWGPRLRPTNPPDVLANPRRHGRWCRARTHELMPTTPGRSAAARPFPYAGDDQPGESGPRRRHVRPALSPAPPQVEFVRQRGDGHGEPSCLRFGGQAVIRIWSSPAGLAGRTSTVATRRMSRAGCGLSATAGPVEHVPPPPRGEHEATSRWRRGRRRNTRPSTLTGPVDPPSVKRRGPPTAGPGLS